MIRKLLALLLFAIFGANGVRAAGMDPASRGRIMDSIKAKYDAVRSLPAPQRRAQMLAFIKTVPSLSNSAITDDGNVTCTFSDGMPYTILESQLPVTPPDKTLNQLFGLPELNSAWPEPEPAPCAFLQGAANDLPASLNARICNSLGAAFGSGHQIVRSLLAGRGYTVAPGDDASLKTLANLGSPGVFLMCTHGGLCEVWDAAKKKFVLDYCLVSSEVWNEGKDKTAYDEGMVQDGLIGLCEATFDYDPRTHKPIDKRFFTISKAFIKKFWKFSKNSFVAIHACTSLSLKDAMAAPAVNASVFFGYNDYGNSDCMKGLLFLFDRMLGANDPMVKPDEAGWPQRPFDYPSIVRDIPRKGFYPVSFSYEGVRHSTTGTCVPLRDAYGLLAPSLKTVSPLPHQRKIELYGLFGEDPGDRSRSVKLAGVALVVDKWEPTKIVAYLPNDENSSHGEMQVVHMGRVSNSRWLSNWKGLLSLRISGPQTMALSADFQLNLVGDPWPYREQAGDRPVEPPVWTLLSSIGSTCSWGARGQELDDQGKVLQAWSGNGTPRVWLDENMGTQGTFGVGGVGDSFQKKVNFFFAILQNMNYSKSGNTDPVPLKLGAWVQEQSLVQARYDSDYNIFGDSMLVDDEPSRFSYGGQGGMVKWTPMQARYGMPRTAPR